MSRKKVCRTASIGEAWMGPWLWTFQMACYARLRAGPTKMARTLLSTRTPWPGLQNSESRQGCFCERKVSWNIHPAVLQYMQCQPNQPYWLYQPGHVIPIIRTIPTAPTIPYLSHIPCMQFKQHMQHIQFDWCLQWIQCAKLVIEYEQSIR